ncbi:MAG: DUF4416 family protein [Candidatus Omnitrophota bacterium]
MGKALRHIPVKLVVGLISARPSRFTLVRHILEKKFGKIDNESGTFNFSCTPYYEKEFGQNLKRKFFSFKRPVRLRKNYRIKLYTNSVEKKLSEKNARTINIDPGYVSLTKLVLFTTKNRSHRIYIDEGIYADLELQFSNKSFRALPWTYPDYKTDAYIEFFNSVRSAYLEQVKKITFEAAPCVLSRQARL